MCERWDLPDFIMDFTSLMPNKSPEPTADVTSDLRLSVLVRHVSSRLRLSFFR